MTRSTPMPRSFSTTPNIPTGFGRKCSIASSRTEKGYMHRHVCVHRPSWLRCPHRVPAMGVGKMNRPAPRRQSLPADHRFGVGAPFQLGVEEELLLVQPTSFALEPATDRVLDEVSPRAGQIKGEISHGMIELVTDVVPGAQEAVA